MIPGEFAATELTAAVEAAMIITPKQGAVTQGRGEVIHHPAFEGDNGLQHNFRANAGEALDAPENRGKGLPDAIETSPRA